MLLRNVIIEHLDKGLSYRPNFLTNLTWTVFCLGSYQEQYELMDSNGVIAARRREIANDWSYALEGKGASCCFDVYAYRLLHITDFSLASQINGLVDFSYDELVQQLAKVLEMQQINLDGIYFQTDDIIFVLNPAASMKKSSFRTV